MTHNKARKLYYDIETMAERGWYWPPRYETNILHVDHYEHLLSVAWQWDGEKTVHVVGLDNFKGYKKNPHDDKELCQFIAALYTKADIVIAHNGNSFDQKMVNARIISHHLAPVPPYKQIDTLRESRKIGRFASNKLDDLGRQLGLGQKLSHGSFAELWLACDNGDPKAWQIMKRYNKQDVVLLREYYNEILPHMRSHPNMALIEGRPEACPRCGAEGTLTAQGTRLTQTATYQRFQCSSCLAWCSARQADRLANKPVYV